MKSQNINYLKIICKIDLIHKCCKIHHEDIFFLDLGRSLEEKNKNLESAKGPEGA